MSELTHTTLPETGYLRLPELLRLIPVSRSTWYRGIQSGRYPEPIKLSEYTSAWKAEDIRLLIDQINNGESTEGKFLSQPIPSKSSSERY